MSASAANSRNDLNHDREVQELREQVRVLGADFKELGRLTKASIGDKVESAKDAAKDVVESGREKAVEYRDRLSDATREQPIKSVLIAAGIGAVLGLIIGRR